jgi:ferredoxin
VLTSARVYGAAATLILVPPAIEDDLAGLTEAVALNNRVLDALGYNDGEAELTEQRDPEALANALREKAAGVTTGPSVQAFTPAGGKRDLLALALAALHEAAPTPVDSIELEPGAPFGTVELNIDGCTLCMACAGVCPTHALRDTADYPRLSFVETACVQCGLCAKTCPEKVITLHPRLDFTGTARNARVIKEEPPFECVRCGKPIGTRSMIATVVQRMTGHSMFANTAALRRIQMCADCRVIDLAETGDDPFAGRARPQVRTTDDYLRERDAASDDDDKAS